jgi:Cu/Ag efflux pump CusA
MRAIVGWSLRFRLVVLGVAAGAMVLGMSQLSRLSLDTLPEFGPPYVEIQTEALGLSAQEVEELITVPLEADLLHGVAFLDEIHSQSVPGLSSIVLYFDPGTDVFRARQVVAERLTQAHALPNVSKPPAMLQPLSSASRIMMVGLSSNDVSLIDMSVLGRWTIRPRLLSVPGVANVSIWGQRERQLQVLVDPDKLRDRGVSLAQVIETTGNALWVSPLTFLDASTPGTGGFIDTANQRFSIQHVLPITSPDDLANVAVVNDRPLANAPQLRLGDVATIVEDHQPLIGDAIVNDGPGLVLVIEKFPGADTRAVTRDVEAALAAMAPGLSGIEIDSSLFRPAAYLDSASDNVAIGVGLGLLLLVLVLGFVLNHWRAALIALVAVPLSLVAAVLVLIALDTGINAFTVGGLVLAVGLLVDDAVATFDASGESLASAHGTGGSTLSMLGEAVVERRTTALYATLIVVAIAIPLLLTSGAIGAFVPTFLTAFLVAVVASMLVALTVTPALCRLLPATGSGTATSPIVARLRTWYLARLERVIDAARATGVILVGMAVVGVIVFAAVLPRVVSAPVPQFADRDLVLRWDAVAGTSAAEMDRILTIAGKELRETPGVETVGGHLGRALLGDQVVGVDSGELWVRLTAAADYTATRAAIQRLVDGYPGFHHQIGTYASAQVDAILPPADADLVVRVYGQDLDLLAQQAGLVQQAVLGVDGAADASVGDLSFEPTLRIEANLEQADKYGLKPGDIRRAATTLLSGILVGSLFEDQKVFEVVVWGIPEIRDNLTTIADLPIDTPAGRQVRLGDVASVTLGPAPSVIRREGVFRYIDVDVTVAGRDITAVADDIDRAIKAVPMPLEYRAEVLEGFSDQIAEAGRLAAAAAAAAIAVLLLLQAAFQSWRLGGLSFVGLLASGSGAVIAVAAGGSSPSIGMALAVLLVVGLAARSTIRLVVAGQRLDLGGSDPRGNALRAASDQFASFVAVLAGTIVALVPFLALWGRPGIELVGPMAVAIIGGLVTTTIVNLFLLPPLYRRFATVPEGAPGSGSLPVEPATTPTPA